MDLALNNLQWLICHKTQPNPTNQPFSSSTRMTLALNNQTNIHTDVCIHAHTYIDVYIHIYIYTHMYTHNQIYMYTYTHINVSYMYIPFPHAYKVSFINQYTPSIFSIKRQFSSELKISLRDFLFKIVFDII